MAANERRLANITLEDVRIIFRNFAGKEDKYNRAGDRNFSVILPEQEAKKMEADGWNIKYLRPREEEDLPTPYIQVAVSYKGRPPRVVMISSKGRTPLGESEIETLDWVSIERADVILNPYEWVVNGKTGIKAYLQTLFLTIEEDELELKYSDVPVAGQSRNSEFGEPWDN